MPKRTVMEVVGEDVQTIEPLTKEERASITGEGLADPNAGPTYIFNINVSQRIREINTSLTNSTLLTLGLASNNYGEHDYSQSLWAKNDKKLRYLALQGELSKYV